HRFDVHPVARTVEHGLKDGEPGAVEDRYRAALERHVHDARLDSVMEGQDAEEQVDRRDSPLEPHLAVAFGPFESLAAHLDPLWHRREHVARAPRLDEYVDVPLASAARL